MLQINFRGLFSYFGVRPVRQVRQQKIDIMGNFPTLRHHISHDVQLTRVGWAFSLVWHRIHCRKTARRAPMEISDLTFSQIAFGSSYFH